MKRTLFLLALVLVCAIFSSCVTAFLISQTIPKTYKENLSDLSANESAVVLFDGDGTAILLIKKWNSNDISKALYGGKGVKNNDKAELTVPPGDNSFTFDVLFTLGDTTYEKRNIELQYYLAAGNTYIVKPRTTSTGSVFARKYEFFLGIYPDVKNSEPLKEWRLGES